MPSHYAHYYFGKEVIRVMPGDVKDIINTNPTCIDAYLIGLQGPDILAFHQPYRYSALNREGRRIHHSSGTDFFRRVSDVLHAHPTPEGYSYAFGCLGHYILDSACHPLVLHYMKSTGLTHAKLEREFDNYILRICRKSPKRLHLEQIIPYNPDLASVISSFYQSTNPRRTMSAIGSMIHTLSIFSSRNRAIRSAAYYGLSAIPIPAVRNKRDMVVFDRPDPASAECCAKMFDRLNKSVMVASSEMDQFLDHLLIGTPLSDRLRPDFLGKEHEDYS